MDNLILNLLVGSVGPDAVGGRLLNVTAATEGVILHLESSPLFFSLDPGLPLVMAGGRKRDPRSSHAPFAARLLSLLEGSSISSLAKSPSDRLLRFELSGAGGEMFSLLYIAIPRRTDLVLLAGDGRVLAGVRSRAGKIYKPPSPPPGELDLFEGAVEKLIPALRSAADSDKPAEFLNHTFRGAGPLLSAEIAAQLAESLDRAVEFLRDIRGMKYKAALYRSAAGDDRTLRLLPSIYGTAPGERLKVFDDPGEAAEALFRRRQRAEAAYRMSGEVASALKLRRRRLKRLRSNLLKDLEQRKEDTGLGMLGDLVLANFGSIHRGADRIEVEDIHKGDGGRILIDLDPSLGPAANAERFYRRARKARRSVGSIEERLKRLETETEEVSRFGERLVGAGGDLQRLRGLHGEIVQRGWLTQRQRRRMKIKTPPGRRFVSSDGLEIIIGRSGRDNEIVTFQIGRDNDFWFHTAGYSGSHVIVRNPGRLHQPPPATLAEAASLAAYYSKARQSSNVQVNWTTRRFLKKRKGGAPGEVLLKGYRSTTALPEIPDTVRKP